MDTQLFADLVDILPAEMLPNTSRPLSDESDGALESPTTPMPQCCGFSLAAASSDHCSSGSDEPHPIIASKLSPVDELLNLIDWQSNGRGRRKRVRGPAETAHEKRVQAEQKRRGDLAQAIDEINELLPPPATAEGVPNEISFSAKSASAAKRTKVATVQEAAEYIRRVQDVAIALIQENKRLAASLKRHPPAVYDRSSQDRTGIQGQDVLRLFMMSAFLIWVSVGIPTPWSPPATAFSSRTLLSVDGAGATAVFASIISYVSSLVYRILAITLAFVFLWLVTLITDMPRITSEQVKAAETHLRQLEDAHEYNNNFILVAKKHAEAMAALNKSLPGNALSDHLFLFAQLIRSIMNVLYVGAIIERWLTRMLGRQEAVLVEARAYMHGARLCNATDCSIMRFWGCTLAASSCVNVGNAHIVIRDNFRLLIVCFLVADAPKCKHACVIMIHRALMTLAEAQAPTDTIANMEASELKLLYKTGEMLREGKLKESFNFALATVPALTGHSQLKALTVATASAFCLGRYNAVVYLASTALRVSIMPGWPGHKMIGFLVVSLYKLGMTREALSLLSPYEQAIVCVPNGRSNVPPLERFFLTCARLVCAQQDFVAVVTHTREMLSIVEVMGPQRFHCVPFLLEIVLERLFEAIDLANRCADQSRLNSVEIFVVHQRGELNELSEAVIRQLSKSASWSPYLQGMVERAQGCQAHLSREYDAASYHLNRSLLEARKYKQLEQEENTLEVMRRLKVAVLGQEKKEAAEPKPVSGENV